MSLYCGFDFGTSNTVVSIRDGDTGRLRVFSDPSLIFLPEPRGGIQERYIGSRAVSEYIKAGMRGRFIQAIKSVLPDPWFRQTEIFGKKYTAEDLVAMIIRHFKELIEAETGVKLDRAVFGRPYEFSEIQANDRLAQQRLEDAARQAGFREISFLYEPVAAAYEYEKQLNEDANVLIADLGGGTSDFSVISIGKGAGVGSVQETVLGTGGVHIGGQDLDGRIMWSRVVEQFGWGSEYESWGKMLPVPIAMYRTICKWEQIPFLKNNKMREELKYIHRGAREKNAIKRLIDLIDNDLGYAVFEAIQNCKHKLSSESRAAISYDCDYFSIDSNLEEAEFREIIGGEREKLANTVAGLVASIDHPMENIQKVFLTGGTSMVPSIIEDFKAMFPRADIVSDTKMFHSVSKGLVYKAVEMNLCN